MVCDAISPKEEALLRQFRQNLDDVLTAFVDDHTLIRWLRARNHDLEKAEEMYRSNLRWRAAQGVDRLLTEWSPPAVVSKFFPGGLCGVDLEGRPVTIDPIGRLDIRGMLRASRPDELLRYQVYRCEEVSRELLQRSLEAGRPITQVVQILDFEGFGRQHLWKPGADLYIEVMKLMEYNYPERLHRTYIINAPAIFGMCWNFVAQFVNEDTRSKFVFLGADWRSALRREMDMRTLPAHWGGDRRGANGDPFCQDKVCMGGPVPEYYYLERAGFFPPGARVVQVSLPAKTPTPFKVRVPGGARVALRYVFCTDSGHINFGVYRKPAGQEERPLEAKDMEVVEPMASYDCGKQPYDGLVVCDRGGMYVMIFSNSCGLGSYFFSKKLSYFVEIINQTGETNVVDAEKTSTRL